MNEIKKVWLHLVLVGVVSGLVVGGVVGLLINHNATNAGIGGPTQRVIENYVPNIKFNGGTFTNLPIQASSTLQVGGVTTLFGNLTLSSASLTNTGGSTSLATTTAASFEYGGNGCFATSTTGTLTEANLLNNDCIYITAAGEGQAVLALTLPATSTMTTLISSAGDCRNWFIDASDVDSATTTTITAGTGWDLVGLDATGAGTGADVLDGAEYGKLVACRQTDTDVIGYVEEWINAD